VKQGLSSNVSGMQLAFLAGAERSVRVGLLYGVASQNKPIFQHIEIHERVPRNVRKKHFL